LITQASGSFSFVTGAPFEKGQLVSGGGYSPNIYSIQMSSNVFYSSNSSEVNAICNPPKEPPSNSSCHGWQQAVYSTNPGPYGGSGAAVLLFQYWVQGVNGSSKCTGGFNPGGFNPNGTQNCFKNVLSKQSPPLYPISALGQLTMTVTESGTTDSLVMTVGAATFNVNVSPTVLGLSKAWNSAEVGVYGFGNFLSAYFPNPTSLEVNTAIKATNNASPQCSQGGFTGESNNLNPICCISNSGGITALESNVLPVLPPTACGAPNPWIELPGGGCATNIAAADGDYPWVTGCGGSRYQTFYWGGSSLGYWVYTNGAADNIAAFNDSGDVLGHGYLNYPTIVGAGMTSAEQYFNPDMVYIGFPQGSDTEGFSGSSVQWTENPQQRNFSSGSSISTSVNASSWTNYASDTSDDLYYSEAYYLDNPNAVWYPIGTTEGVAEWISVAPDNSSLWALTSANELWKFNGTINPIPTPSGFWSYWNSNINQAAAGPRGSYAFMSESAAGSTLVYQPPVGVQYNIPTGGTGQPVLGPIQVGGTWGTQLSIGANGNIWVIDYYGNIWEYVPQNSF
jgi:hypothetical protein